MSALPKPDIILTHESDLDGLVAGVLLQRLARKLFGEVRLEAWNFSGWRQRPMSEKSAWATDLTFEARLDKPNWAVIDHHKTDYQPRHALLIHDPEKSASRLCYELCQAQGLGSPALDRLVHLANVGDLFLEDHPDFVIASDYASLVKVYGFWNLHRLVGGEIETLLDHPLLEVMAVKRRIEDPIGYAWSRANVQAISPTVGYVETAAGNVNLIMHRLLEEAATPYPVLVTLGRRGNGLMVASLRSRNGEAIQVAERLQGGGHANASGATLPKSVRNLDDAVLYLRQALNPPAEPALNNLASLLDALEPTQA